MLHRIKEFESRSSQKKCLRQLVNDLKKAAECIDSKQHVYLPSLRKLNFFQVILAFPYDICQILMIKQGGLSHYISSSKI